MQWQRAACLTVGCILSLSLVVSKAVVADIIEVPSTASTIQVALDLYATPGDTILVKNSSTYAPISISYRVTLLADTGQTPTIGGSGDFAVSASVSDSVVIRGFILDGDDLTYSIVDNRASHFIIEDCVFQNASGYARVGIEGTPGLEVRRCRFENMDFAIVQRLIAGSPGMLCPATGRIVVQDCVFDSCDVQLGCIGYGEYSGNTMRGGDFYQVPEDLVVRKNIFSDCTIDFASACPDTMEHNIFYDESTVDCTINFSNNLDADPLFCDSREGTSELTLRMDSPAAPGNNTWGELIGAYGVECAWGTLARNTVVSEDVFVVVLEDVSIPSGKSLTLSAGSSLLFDDDDESAGGEDTALNELTVEGRLEIDGTSGSPVTLESSLASPAAGDWY